MTSAILQVATLVGFSLYVRRRIGKAASIAAVALLATYPGIYYWAGLPYSYASIVPACLGAMVVLIEVERQPPWWRVALLSLALGILLLAYDLLRKGGPDARMSVPYKVPKDHRIGMGLWSAGRGYLTHHLVNTEMVALLATGVS